MKKTITQGIVLILFSVVGTCCAASSHRLEPIEKAAANGELDSILEKLNKAAASLHSYQCQIVYNFSQPLFDSQTLRKGNLYYKKREKQSKLRMNFDTIKQDDEKQQKQKEQYIFDGVWITHINYQLKEVKKHQLADPNKPVDTFELVQKNFPIIGFSKNEDLEKEFEITIIEDTTNKTSIHLHLKVKPESVYKDDYTSIDFWIDKELNLPSKIIAVNLDEDIYEINLLNAKVNQALDDKIFDVEIPAGFAKPTITPLKK